MFEDAAINNDLKKKTFFLSLSLHIRAMASLSEEVLLVVKKVRQKKQDGTLYLMAERIAWSPEGKDRFTVSHLYADIRCERSFCASITVQKHRLMECYLWSVQVRKSAQTAKQKFNSNWSFTPARVPHSTFQMTAPHSKTGRLLRNCSSSSCPSSRRKLTRNWRRKTGELLRSNVTEMFSKSWNEHLKQLQNHLS